MSSRRAKLSDENLPTFRPRPLDLTKPLPIVKRDLDEEDPVEAAMSAAHRAVPSMPTGMEHEEEAEKHIARALKIAPLGVSSTTNKDDQIGIPTPGVKIVEPVEAPGRPPPRYVVPVTYFRYLLPSDEALDASLEYDLTESDSEWVEENKSLFINQRGNPFDALELLIDRFEKTEARTHSEIQPVDASKVLQGLPRGTPTAPDVFCRAALDYYHRKRNKPPRKGEFLLDRLKPPPDPKDKNPFTAFRPRIEEQKMLRKTVTRHHQRASQTGGSASAEVDYAAALRQKLTVLKKDVSMARDLSRLIIERETNRVRLLELNEKLIGSGIQLNSTYSSLMIATRSITGINSIENIKKRQSHLARSLLGRNQEEGFSDDESESQDEINEENGDEDKFIPISDYENFIQLQNQNSHQRHQQQVIHHPSGMANSIAAFPLDEYTEYCQRQLSQLMLINGMSSIVSNENSTILLNDNRHQSEEEKEEHVIMDSETDLIHVRGVANGFHGRARLGRGGRIIFDRNSIVNNDDDDENEHRSTANSPRTNNTVNSMAPSITQSELMEIS